jgi:aldehyde dehydrogenase (NAD+)
MEVSQSNTYSIDKVIKTQRAFFASGETRSIAYRMRLLKTLRKAIVASEQAIIDALHADLKRSTLDGYTAEVGSCLMEIRLTIKCLRKWMKGRRVGGSPLLPLSQGRIIPEPLGLCLIMSPWNYPFRLAMSPLIAALAAGNCVVLKPSEISVHTERAITEMIGKHFDDRAVSVVCGGAEVAQTLLGQRFGHIFYTGGETVGRAVMMAAAQHTTPVTLELGGKSPCIVGEHCDLKKTAKRVVWGKFLNAGQTCVAPDYMLVHKHIKATLLEEMRACALRFYGASPRDSADYGRIINERHFDRLSNLLQDGDVIMGGQMNRESLHIEPTLIDNVPAESPLMTEEIFGPILPVLEFSEVSEVIDLVNGKAKPLALYIFSGNRGFQQAIISGTSSGAVCINDTVVHLTALTLPFGGVGGSGFGRCHGKAGFDTFSNPKSVFSQTTLFDIPKRFPPSDKFGLRLLRCLLR